MAENNPYARIYPPSRRRRLTPEEEEVYRQAVEDLYHPRPRRIPAAAAAAADDDDDDDDGDEIVIKNKPKKETKQAEVKENDNKKTEKKKNENYRTYDVTVTYDFYYCVPRMWLMGYNSNGQPLSEKEMKEDVMEEYRNKTVTFEQHPGTGLRYVSVHPCRHSLLLKKMIQNFENSGKKLEIHMSILIFLKFLHSVVPTIQYDFTMDINF